jgi:hypothetical protein
MAGELVSEPDVGDNEHSTAINDIAFMRAVRRVRSLRDFLLQQAIAAPDGVSTAWLNLLKYRLDGRPPTEPEWRQVERNMQLMYGVMPDPLRRKFVLGETPAWLTFLPLYLGVLAAASLVGAAATEGLTIGGRSATLITLSLYLIWLASLGAVGSVASIGMNALSIQDDATFDLTNHRLVQLRIFLGALLGMVLTVPLGFEHFTVFCQNLANGTISTATATTTASGKNSTLTEQAVFLLLPFLFGFSTSLVIMVLNRLIDTVRALFGGIASGIPSAAQSQSGAQNSGSSTGARPRSRNQPRGAGGSA